MYVGRWLSMAAGYQVDHEIDNTGAEPGLMGKEFIMYLKLPLISKERQTYRIGCQSIHDWKPASGYIIILKITLRLLVTNLANTKWCKEP